MFWRILAPTVQIYVQLQKQDESARYALELNGHAVCQRTWRLCLGVGKSRMTKIRNAIINGRVCPGDGRYVPKMHETPPPPGSAREKCHEFFERAYHALAEPLPETVWRTQEQADQARSAAAKTLRRRGKRPRQMYKSTQGGSGYNPTIRFLPPGSITDYLDLCRFQYAPLQISRKVFCRATRLRIDLPLEHFQCFHWLVEPWI